ncbi:MAG TPA: DUF5995 family protein [Mycobacteriales bacterium]|nr:DUF5995 family protein [Mycobacteriales bacterium]
MSAVRLRPLIAALVLALVATVTGVATVQRRASADPVYIPWPQLLPGLTDGYDPGSSNVCVSGNVNCIDSLVREMQRRYEPLRDTCSDQALFALTYLRVTQTYAWSARQPGYYQDPGWTNHAVAVFAKYYLRAFDAWSANPNSTAVPQAWKIAFDGAQAGKIMGTGNFLLGLNAHINHDLALAMSAAGLTQADGQSAKPNYDKIDALLNSVTLPLVAELSARFDPSMDDSTLPLNLDAVAIGNLMFGWREQAWRNAELISLAPALTRPVVQATIDANSVTQATLYSTALTYLPSAPGRVDRDTFCAMHHDDPAPEAYPFGTPTD